MGEPLFTNASRIVVAHPDDIVHVRYAIGILVAQGFKEPIVRENKYIKQGTVLVMKNETEVIS